MTDKTRKMVASAVLGFGVGCFVVAVPSNFLVLILAAVCIIAVVVAAAELAQ